MKKPLLTALLGLFIFFYFAPSLKAQHRRPKRPSNNQEAGIPTGPYEVRRNDPIRANNLNFGISPFYLDAGPAFPWVGTDFSLRYNYEDKFSFFVDYRRAYNILEIVPYGSKVIDMTGTYYFSSIITKHKKMFHLAQTLSKRSVGTRVHHYIIMPCDRLILQGIRLGYIERKVGMGLYNFPMQGFDPKDSMKSYSVDGALMHCPVYALGYSLSTTHFLAVKFKLYGKRRYTQRKELYTDFLVAPKITMSSPLDRVITADDPNGGTYVVATHPLILDDHIKRSHFGFRTGYLITSLGDCGAYLGMEAGLWPGINIKGNSHNEYFLFRFGMMFNTRVGPKARGDKDIVKTKKKPVKAEE